MKKAVICLALVGALLIAWYYGSPKYALSQIAAAAEANDTERLSSYIDFPALRESIKAELKAQMASKLAEETDGIEGLGGLIAMNMVDGMVDGMVTPEMLRNAFAAKKPLSDQPRTPFAFDAEGAEFVRDSFDQFRLRHAGRPDLVFGRRGLGWKLIGIRAPVDVKAEAGPEAPQKEDLLQTNDLAGTAPTPEAVAEPQQEGFADPCVGHYLNETTDADKVGYAIDVTNRPLEVSIRFADYGSIKAVSEQAVASGELEFIDYDDKTKYYVSCSDNQITVKSATETFVGIKTDRELQMSGDGE